MSFEQTYGVKDPVLIEDTDETTFEEDDFDNMIEEFLLEEDSTLKRLKKLDVELRRKGVI